MRTTIFFRLAIRATVGFFSLLSIGTLAMAYDDLPIPPPPPEGWVQPAKQTERSVVQNVEDQTAKRFAAATGGDPNGQLSQQQAKAAGWGFVSDHFNEIDRAGTGQVRLDDVLRFMSQRTPQQIMRMKAAAKMSSQVEK